MVIVVSSCRLYVFVDASTLEFVHLVLSALQSALYFCVDLFQTIWLEYQLCLLWYQLVEGCQATVYVAY